MRREVLRHPCGVRPLLALSEAGDQQPAAAVVQRWRPPLNLDEVVQTPPEWHGTEMIGGQPVPFERRAYGTRS